MENIAVLRRIQLVCTKARVAHLWGMPILVTDDEEVPWCRHRFSLVIFEACNVSKWLHDRSTAGAERPDWLDICRGQREGETQNVFAYLSLVLPPQPQCIF